MRKQKKDFKQQNRGKERDYKEGAIRGKEARDRGEGKGYGVREYSRKPIETSNNSPEWYMNSEMVKNAMADFLYEINTGIRIRDVANMSLGVNGYVDNFTDAGGNLHKSDTNQVAVAALRWTPAINPTDTADYDAVNLSAQELFTYVASAFSGTVPYQAADLEMYVLAVDSIISFYAQLRRAYGLVNYYSILNKYVPKRILETLGFDYEDFYSHKKQYEDLINIIANHINSLAIPSGSTYLARHIWMNTNIWKDEACEEATIYAYVQDAYFRYDHTAGQYGGQLRLIPWYSDTNTLDPKFHTYSDVESFWNNNFKPYFVDSDVVRMSAAFLRAFGSNIINLPMMDGNYSIVPTVSQEVLDQINNTTFMGMMVKNYDNETDLGDIRQNLGSILYTPYVTNISMLSPYNMKVMVNTSQDAISREMNLVLTRNVATVFNADVYIKASGASFDYPITNTDVYDADGWQHLMGATTTTAYVSKIHTCGSEIFNYMTVGMNHRVPSSTDEVDFYFDHFAGPTMESWNRPSARNSVDSPTYYREICEQMYYAPHYVIYSAAGNIDKVYHTVPWTGTRSLAYLHKYTFIEPEVLLKMNSAVMFNMLNIVHY